MIVGTSTCDTALAWPRTVAAVWRAVSAVRDGGAGRVVRGGPVRRTRDVRVRLTPPEHAAWSAARAVIGRRELGAWVRVTVSELLDTAPERTG